MEPIPTHYTPEMSFLSMNIRSRREMSTRDAANIRQFEHWRSQGIKPGRVRLHNFVTKCTQRR